MTGSETVPPAASARPRVVYLHVGSPKTGTTFMQNMLQAHRDGLLESGVLYPPARLAAHHDEARDLRNIRLRDGSPHHRSVPGSWDRMVRRIREWDGEGIVVISSEILAWTSPRDVERAVRSLQPAEVHVILTQRDLVRQIPAVWQETVKNRNTMAYAEFLDRIDERDGAGPRNIWDGQDPTRVLARWGTCVPADRVHVVTVPARGGDPGLLWQRFARVLGVDGDDFPPVGKGANVSLGVAETEVVRRLNAQLSNSPWPWYSRHVKHGIAQGVLVSRDSPRLVLPDTMLPWVQTRTKQTLEEISQRGYDVVGSLDDLLVPEDGAGIGPMPVPDPDRLAEAYGTAAGYLARQLMRAGGGRAGNVGRKPQGSRQGARVRRRFSALADRNAAVGGVRRVYRAGRRLGRG